LRAKYTIYAAGANAIRGKVLIKNNGENTATNVMAKLNIPSGARFNSFKGAAVNVCKLSGKNIICNVGSLTRGSISVLFFKFNGPNTVGGFDVIVTSAETPSMTVFGEWSF